MDTARVLRAFRIQAEWCHRLGSDLYGRLVSLSADDLEAGGPVAGLLDGWEGEPGRQALALRMMGGLHHLVLTGRAPRLAAHYPSAGGQPSWPEAGEAFLEVITTRADVLRPWLFRNLQTNEVNRSAVLLGGLLEVARRTGLPLRLLEIGSSAGLNLLVDRYRYDLGVGTWGPPGSPVRLQSEWSGAAPDLATQVRIGDRAGCDPYPIDPADPGQAARLLAFVWPDQTGRMARLRAALGVAAQEAPQVRRARAAEWLPEMLGQPAPGVATVVMHSVVWHYISAEEQDEVTDVIEAAGRAATPEAPLAWLHAEALTDEGMAVRLRLWPPGGEDLLGRAHTHGAYVRWQV